MPPEDASAEPAGRLTLEASGLSWLGDDADPCVHGDVACRVGTIDIVARHVNLTAASLFLLRTLEHDHTPSSSVAPDNQLLPCCGHSPWVVAGERFSTINMGCDYGVDVWVRHAGARVELAFEALRESLPASEWHEAVVTFADRVLAFYDVSPPRRRSGDAVDRDGWDAFWAEWVERRTRARPASPVSRPVFVEDVSALPRSLRRLWATCVQALRPRGHAR